MVGYRSVVIYDENKNGIHYNTAMPSCFGYQHKPTRDNFDILEGEFLVENKKEFRAIVCGNQSTSV